MKQLKKCYFLLLIWAIIGLTYPVVAQTYSYQIQLRTSVVATRSGNVTATGSAFHQLTWNKVGTVSACSIKVDSSADGITWNNGDIIAAQVCTSNGQVLSTSIIPNFVRINVSSFIGTGLVAAVLDGYVNSPTGGPASTVGGLAFPAAGATVPVGTINASTCPPADKIVAWTQLANNTYQTQFSVNENTKHPPTTGIAGRLNLGCYGLDINGTQGTALGGANNFVNISYTWGNAGLMPSGTNGAAFTVFTNNLGTQQNFGGGGQLLNIYSDARFTDGITLPLGPEPAFSGIRSTIADNRTSGGIVNQGFNNFSANLTIATTSGGNSCSGSGGNCYTSYFSSIDVSGTSGAHGSDIVRGFNSKATYSISTATAIGYAGFNATASAVRFPFVNYGFWSGDFGTNAADYNFVSNGVNSAGTPSGYNTFTGPTFLGSLAHVTANYQLELLGAVKLKAAAGVRQLDLFGSTSGSCGLSTDATSTGITSTCAFIGYKGITTAGLALPLQTGNSVLSGQTTSLGPTTIVTVGAASASYLISANVFCKTAVATATVTLSIGYTDPSNTAQTVTPTAAACTTLGAASFAQINAPIRAKNGTNITYTTTAANSPNYDVSVQAYQQSTN